MIEEVFQSVRMVHVFKRLFPGKWKRKGGYWIGENFTITKKDGKYFRTDTNEEIAVPKRKKRSHFVHAILNKKLGGEWKRDRGKQTLDNQAIWSSPDHEFVVYRTTSNKTKRRIYRRSDTKEIIYAPNGRKF